jgi:hypothetical protein
LREGINLEGDHIEQDAAKEMLDENVKHITRIGDLADERKNFPASVEVLISTPLRSAS